MASFSSTEDLLSIFQRDLNRVADIDRNTRRRGLQKLLDDLPWDLPRESAKTLALNGFLNSALLPTILKTLPDSVEKCRELALKILQRIVKRGDLFEENSSSITQALCSRISDIPFPEPAEELRLTVLQCISQLIKGSDGALCNQIANISLISVSKSLQDLFPAAKCEASEIVIAFSERCELSVQLNFRLLLKGILLNYFCVFFFL
jgi:hypothetical protein